jgi:hypothetical protein
MSYTINRAITALEKGDTKEAIKILKNPDTIHIVWSTDDVYYFAKGLGKKYHVTKKAAREILHNLKQHHDSSEGINWDVIKSSIMWYKYVQLRSV